METILLGILVTAAGIFASPMIVVDTFVIDLVMVSATCPGIVQEFDATVTVRAVADDQDPSQP